MSDECQPNVPADLREENARLRQRLFEVQETLEELESTVSAIRDGLVDAVVVDRREMPEVWMLEADRLQLDLALKAAHAGTWEWNVVADTIHFSESFCSVIGLPSANSNCSLSDLLAVVHDDDRDRVAGQFRASPDGPSEEYYDEFRIRRPDGQIRWMASRGKVMRVATGQAEYVIGVMLDITERKLAEETLRQSARRKDEFLAMLAHEIRNPLAAIKNAITLLRVPKLGGEDRAATQEVLDRQIEQLNRLIDDLLDISRFTHGKVELKQSPLALPELLGRIAEALAPRFAKAQQQFALTIEDDQLWVHGDATRLEQVFVNILTNAAKYTNDGGSISMRAWRDGAMAVVSVKDTGIGIGPELLPRIFDLFTQAERGLDRAQGGLGIGLTLVRRLVELHGGSVVAYSDGLGRGSEFIVQLPCCRAPEERRTDVETPVDASPGRRILVVDDNRDAALTLSLLLKASGHQTVVAYSGPEALQVVGGFQPEIALLDIGLPEMSGFELAPRVREAIPDVRLIALSGYSQPEDRKRAIESGFDLHLIKPVKHSELLAALNAGKCRSL